MHVTLEYGYVWRYKWRSMKPHASDHAVRVSENASAALPDPPPSVPAAPSRAKPQWLLDAERRLEGHRSLLETLTEEDWEFLRNYDGPEVLGPPPPPPMKRRPRRRDET